MQSGGGGEGEAPRLLRRRELFRADPSNFVRWGFVSLVVLACVHLSVAQLGRPNSILEEWRSALDENYRIRAAYVDRALAKANYVNRNRGVVSGTETAQTSGLGEEAEKEHELEVASSLLSATINRKKSILPSRRGTGWLVLVFTFVTCSLVGSSSAVEKLDRLQGILLSVGGTAISTTLVAFYTEVFHAEWIFWVWVALESAFYVSLQTFHITISLRMLKNAKARAAAVAASSITSETSRNDASFSSSVFYWNVAFAVGAFVPILVIIASGKRDLLAMTAASINLVVLSAVGAVHLQWSVRTTNEANREEDQVDDGVTMV